MPKDKHGYSNVFVVVDRLSKQAISTPCHKQVTSKDMARMYIIHIYRYYGPPETIVLIVAPSLFPSSRRSSAVSLESNSSFLRHSTPKQIGKQRL
jgi:hypothetical protein